MINSEIFTIYSNQYSLLCKKNRILTKNTTANLEPPGCPAQSFEVLCSFDRNVSGVLPWNRVLQGDSQRKSHEADGKYACMVEVNHPELVVVVDREIVSGQVGIIADESLLGQVDLEKLSIRHIIRPKDLY